jgi:hypothetical protein
MAAECVSETLSRAKAYQSFLTTAILISYRYDSLGAIRKPLLVNGTKGVVFIEPKVHEAPPKDPRAKRHDAVRLMRFWSGAWIAGDDHYSI